MIQYGRLGKIFVFGYGTNDASGNHSAGAPSQVFVRRVGASADAAPVRSSVSATLLTHANYPTGCFEVLITADTSEGFSAGERYLVFAHASTSGVSAVSLIGIIELSAPPVNVVTIDGTSVSAAVSAITYVAALSALRTVPVLSAQAASVIAAAALADYDAPTSADVSAIVAANAGAGINSAQASSIMAGVLANYDVPTSADVSAIVEAVSMTSASVSAIVYTAVLSAHAARQTPTSATLSVVVAGALANYDVPTSADISAIVTVVARQVLIDYDVPTSADVSAIDANTWRIFTIPEPGAIPDFASCTPMSALAWLVMLAKNRMTQTSAIAVVQTSAGAEFASASVSDDGTTFTRGPWVS